MLQADGRWPRCCCDARVGRPRPRGLGLTFVAVELGGDNGGARGWVGGLLGVVSAALLGAAIRWAHHWGLAADLIVIGWALSTMAAVAVSVWSLRTSETARSLAKLGVSLAGVSLLALCLAGLLY